MFLIALSFFISPVFADPLDSWHVRSGVLGGYTLNAVAYGNGIFVVVGNKGVIQTSPDGTNWTVRTSGILHDLKGITFGNNMFVAVGDAVTIITSLDGINWVSRSSGTTGWFGGIAFGGIAYGNGIFVVDGSLVSQDGIHWTAISPNYRVIRFGDDKFLSIGCCGLDESHDGINWNFRHIVTGSLGFTDIALHNGTYVMIGAVFNSAFGPLPDNERIWSSTDGTNWTETFRSDSMGPIARVAYGNGHFVAVNSSWPITSTAKIISSSDGMEWKTVIVATLPEWTSMRDIVYGNHTFVAVGLNNVILQSDPLVDPVGVPTLSEWGMMLFMVMAGVVAFLVLHRQRRVS